MAKSTGSRISTAMEEVINRHSDRFHHVVADAALEEYSRQAQYYDEYRHQLGPQPLDRALDRGGLNLGLID